MMNGWNGGMTWEGWFFMSLFWVLLVGVIVWAAAQLFPGQRGTRAETHEEPAEGHGGHIAAESAGHGRGAIFRVTLRTLGTPPIQRWFGYGKGRQNGPPRGGLLLARGPR